MFSHIVIWWTDPKQPDAVEKLLVGINKYLRPIPGVLHLHAGRMIWSPRPVVDKTFQVGMTIIFPDKQAHDDYMQHPLHDQFVKECFEKLCIRDLVYDYA